MPGYWIYENYKSVMNYRYVHKLLDYSDGTNGFNDYDDWGNLDLTWFELPNSLPPEIPLIPNGPTVCRVNESYSFSTSTIDPNTDDVRYIWDWGDESPHEWTAFYSSGDTISKTHTFTKEGKFEVRVRAEDPKGAYSYFSDPLFVNVSDGNLPPEKPTIRGNQNGNVNSEYEYIFTSSDGDGDKIFYRIEWNEDDIEETELVESGASITLTHSWENDGAYIVRAKAIDEHGEESEIGYLNVVMPRQRTLFSVLIEKLINILKMFLILY
jgi:hypothetical protein